MLAGWSVVTLLIALALPVCAQTEHPFELAPGEWRWVDFTIRQVPTEVDCRFRVLKGDGAVHIELLPRDEFHRFSMGRKHGTLALTAEARSSSFRRIVDQPGRYAVVIVNAKNAAPATVSLEVSTDSRPNTAVTARELPQSRRLAVILISFVLFFVTVTWSAWKLTRAMRTP